VALAPIGAGFAPADKMPPVPKTTDIEGDLATTMS
jgi:hypothetical protein